MALKPLNKPSMELLSAILLTESETGLESGMSDLIVEWIGLFAPDAKVTVDDLGSIYLTVGSADLYPLVVAHTDTVHSLVVPNVTVTYPKGKKVTTEVLPYTVNEEVLKSGFKKWSSPTGIGGDDKCGIFLILDLLRRRKAGVFPVPFKAFFPVGEEKGFVGTNEAVRSRLDWFSDVSYMIEPDRRGFGDIISDNGRTTNKEFTRFTEPIWKQYGYKVVTGSVTDIFKLVDEVPISCFNMSCGYYQPHTADEYILEEDLVRAGLMLRAVMRKVPHDRFYVLPPKPKTVAITYPRTNYSGYTSSYSAYTSKKVYGDVVCPFTQKVLRMETYSDYQSPKPANGSFYSARYDAYEESVLKVLFYLNYIDELRAVSKKAPTDEAIYDGVVAIAQAFSLYQEGGTELEEEDITPQLGGK